MGQVLQCKLAGRLNPTRACLNPSSDVPLSQDLDFKGMMQLRSIVEMFESRVFSR